MRVNLICLFIRKHSVVCAFLLGAMFFAPQSVFAEPELSAQLEKLRNSLPPGDAARQEIGLRLADSYFYDAVELAKQAELSDNASLRSRDLNAAKQIRQRALELYRESEQATKNEDLKVRIQFQQAQILEELLRRDEALEIWRRLAKQDLQAKIKTEALLKLAQSLENSPKKELRAEAESYYKQALNFCRERDLCGFVHYRYGWLLRNRGEHARALEEIQQSLWDSRGNVQEEVLRDLLVFIVEIPGDGSAALAVIEPLAQKLGRPDLLITLAENFYSAGNKAAGTMILRLANDRTPHLGRQIRLLEEYYGARSWDQFRSMLVAIEQRLNKGFSPDELQGDAEKILRRLVIQLDGERLSKKENAAEFSQTTLLYLKLFPGQEVAFRMVEGWLAAQSSNEEKIRQVSEWLDEAKSGNRQKLNAQNILALWETRAALAQKLGDLPKLRESLGALISLQPSLEKQREASYMLARSYYEAKKYAESLPRFRELAELKPGVQPDKFAVLSQNLALDVLNAQGNYDGIVEQANLWLNNKDLAKLSGMSDELAQVKEIANQARFEQAVKAGDVRSSLDTFLNYCLNGVYLPKSCDNAKNLAVKLKEQNALIAVLEKQGDRKQLINEYESAGFFGKAAELLEQEKPLAKNQWASTEAIRIALLFELEGRMQDRDRWIRAVTDRQRKSKKGFDISEALLLQTLKEAKLLSASELSLPWSKEILPQVAYSLEQIGKGSARTRKILLESKVDLGALWSKMILDEIHALDQKQRKIDFYGASSKSKFERRLKAIQNLDNFSLGYLDGASRETKIKILLVLTHAYRDLSKAILETPLPQGLEAAVQEEIHASLAQMADPFVVKAENFKKLTEEQIGKLGDGQGSAFMAMLSGEAPINLVQEAQLAGSGAAPELWKRSEIQAYVQELNQNPDAEQALTGLKEFFTQRQELRLSSYFEGRIRNLRKGTL